MNARSGGSTPPSPSSGNDSRNDSSYDETSKLILQILIDHIKECYDCSICDELHELI